MKTVKLGILLPHEIFSALYHFGSGDLFHALALGTPEEPKQERKVCF